MGYAKSHDLAVATTQTQNKTRQKFVIHPMMYCMVVLNNLQLFLPLQMAANL